MPKTKEKPTQRTLAEVQQEVASVGEARARQQEELASLDEARGVEALEESRLLEEAMRSGKPATSSRKLDKIAQREEEIKRQLPVVAVLLKKLDFERLVLEIEEAEAVGERLEEEYVEAEKAFREVEAKFHEAAFSCRDHSQRVGDLERAHRRAEAELAGVDSATRERLEGERRERAEAAERARQIHQEQAIKQRWAEAGFVPCETEEQREALKSYAEKNSAHVRIAFPSGS